MKQAIEDRRSDRRILEDLAPLGDPPVGGQDDRTVLVSAADHLEEVGGRLAGKRQVAELVDLCRVRHSWTYADPATMPTSFEQRS